MVFPLTNMVYVLLGMLGGLYVIGLSSLWLAEKIMKKRGTSEEEIENIGRVIEDVITIVG